MNYTTNITINNGGNSRPNIVTTDDMDDDDDMSGADEYCPNADVNELPYM